MGFSPQNRHKLAVAQLGMNLLNDSYLIRDELQKSVFALHLSSEGFPPRSIDKPSVAQSGMNFSDGSFPIRDEPWRLPSGDEPSGR